MVLPDADQYNATGRAYPDVSALAGVANGYCVAYKGTYGKVGGTSAATPDRHRAAGDQASSGRGQKATGPTHRDVAAVWLETKMYILVLAIFGHFPAELGSRTVLNGFSLKNGAEFTQNHPRGPILRPFGGHFPV